MAESRESEERYVAYVNGSEEEQEKQKAEIRALWRPIPFPDSDCFSDWQEAEKGLKGGVIMVVTDVTVLSRDPEEWAERAIVFIERGAILEPNNEKHKEWWNAYLDRGPRNTLMMGGRGRVLLGLEERYSELLQEEDAQREQREQQDRT